MENFCPCYRFFFIILGEVFIFPRNAKRVRFLLPPVRGGVTVPGSRKAAAVRSSLQGSAETDAKSGSAFCVRIPPSEAFFKLDFTRKF